jgi:hypothetical protein
MDNLFVLRGGATPLYVDPAKPVTKADAKQYEKNLNDILDTPCPVSYAVDHSKKVLYGGNMLDAHNGIVYDDNAKIYLKACNIQGPVDPIERLNLCMSDPDKTPNISIPLYGGAKHSYKPNYVYIRGTPDCNDVIKNVCLKSSVMQGIYGGGGKDSDVVNKCRNVAPEKQKSWITTYCADTPSDPLCGCNNSVIPRAKCNDVRCITPGVYSVDKCAEKSPLTCAEWNALNSADKTFVRQADSHYDLMCGGPSGIGMEIIIMLVVLIVIMGINILRSRRSSPQPYR